MTEKPNLQKIEKKTSKPKLVLRVLPGYLEGREPQNRKIEKLDFPQHIVEGLLNSRRRVSDRPSWILIFKTLARKPTNVVVIVILVFFVVPRTRSGSKGSRCNMDLVRA